MTNEEYYKYQFSRLFVDSNNQPQPTIDLQVKFVNGGTSNSTNWINLTEKQLDVVLQAMIDNNPEKISE